MSAEKESMRKKAVEYAPRWIGTPFNNKGGAPGFGCHGFIIEVLKGCGLIRRGENLTPDNVEPMLSLRHLCHRFKDKKVNEGRPGCIIFWFTDSSLKVPEHVDIFIDNEYVVGMSGGKETQLCIKMNRIGYKRTPHEIFDQFMD